MNSWRPIILAGCLLLPMWSMADDDEILPPEEAFPYTVSVDGDRLVLDWDIQPDHYLYRERFGFSSETPSITLGDPVYPAGKIYEDEFFGEMEIYKGPIRIEIPYTTSSSSPASLALQLRLQGCNDRIGICYAPQRWSKEIALPRAGGIDLAALLGQSSAGGEDFLPPDEAFRFAAEFQDPTTLRASWEIAPGYYLYKNKFKFATDSEFIQLAPARLPTGKLKHDEYFGDSEVYYDRVEAIVPFARSRPDASTVTVTLGYQGCAEDGICYTPIKRELTLMLTTASAVDLVGELPPPPGAMVSEQDKLATLILEGRLLLVMATFFGLGLLLAFTPCVLPMVPILSGIIAGQGDNMSALRGFVLSLTYVLGMAFTYTIAGAMFAAAGDQVQAVFQQPWIIVTFAGLFVVLALAMFGGFDLQLPSALQTRLAAVSNQQRVGTFAGTAIMGALSALIVTACVAPPLVATLAVIGQTGDMFRGASSLFALSMGMGAPLLVVGASAGKLLPKAGAWMDTVKALFGVMMLGLAVWMLSRLLSPQITLSLWGGLGLVSGLALIGLFSLGALKGRSIPARAFGALVVVYGVTALWSASQGGHDPLKPWSVTHLEEHSLPFVRIKSVADLEARLDQARASGQTLMLDFYADWCVSCIEMERYTFTDQAVQTALESTLLLQADVTANDEDDQALLKYFGIFGPPTIAFFGPDGAERKAFRLVGFVPAENFRQHLVGALAPPGQLQASREHQP